MLYRRCYHNTLPLPPCIILLIATDGLLTFVCCVLLVHDTKDSRGVLFRDGLSNQRQRHDQVVQRSHSQREPP